MEGRNQFEDINARIQFEQAHTFEIMQRERMKSEQSMVAGRYKAELEVWKAQEVTKARVDAQREAECLQDVIAFDESGSVIVRRQFFFKPEWKLSLLNVVIIGTFLLYPVNADSRREGVLLMKFKRSNAVDTVEELFLNDLTTKSVSKKFRERGIAFRSPERKYKTLLGEFVRTCVETSKKVYMPEYHGFYRCEGKLCYSSEGEPTWKEVARQWARV